MSAVAIVGNVSWDVVDGGAPRAGGCPTFAVQGLRLLGHPAQIVTRCADEDRPSFEDALRAPNVDLEILHGKRTAAFELVYDGGSRAMTVTSLGDEWRARDATYIAPDVEWVHVAPLTRSEFGADVIAALARGRRLSLDGQGLVREPHLGPLTQTSHFVPEVLRHVSVLKLAEEEAEIVAGGELGADTVAALGVDEVLVTLGERGVDVWVGAEMTRVPAEPVRVETTGAGDVFAVGYLAARSDGAPAVEAARSAVRLVTRLLEARASKTGA